MTGYKMIDDSVRKKKHYSGQLFVCYVFIYLDLIAISLARERNRNKNLLSENDLSE